MDDGYTEQQVRQAKEDAGLSPNWSYPTHLYTYWLENPR